MIIRILRRVVKILLLVLVFKFAMDNSKDVQINLFEIYHKDISLILLLVLVGLVCFAIGMFYSSIDLKRTKQENK